MKHLVFLLVFAVAAHAADDIRVFWWQESRDEKTGEKQFGFMVAPLAVKEVFEADARGDDKTAETLSAKLPKEAWDYVLMLNGEASAYSKAKITLFVPHAGEIEITSGNVEVDRKKNTVRLALKVNLEGKVVDFAGNGLYPIEKKPNQSSQPTPRRG